MAHLISVKQLLPSASVRAATSRLFHLSSADFLGTSVRTGGIASFGKVLTATGKRRAARTLTGSARVVAEGSAGQGPMVKAIRIHEYGGPEVMKWEDVEVGSPEEGQVRLRHTAVGLNFIDTYFRRGIYKSPVGLPFVNGMEAVGVVEEVGSGVTEFKVGDRAGYAGRPIGAYSEERLVPADRLVKIPDSVSDEVAASLLLKGMTAWYLLRRSFKVAAGQYILVHAAAGGTGSLLCQWGKALGAHVIGTVSTPEKAAQAREDGCEFPIVTTEEDFVKRTREITGGKGVAVVYDGVGKDTLMGSLDSLAPFGMLVSFGQSSGMPDPLPLQALGSRGSLSVTRPSLMDYTAARADLVAAAEEVFALVESGVLRVRVNQRFPLKDAAKAHEALEGRKTTGSTVFLV